MWRGLGVLRLAVPATGERADQPRDTERRRTGAGRDSPARAGAALDVGEPHQAAGAEDRGDEEMQPQAEDVMRTQLELLLLLHRDPTVDGAPDAPPRRPSSDAPTSPVIITLTGMAALASHLAAVATPDLTITAALAGSTVAPCAARWSPRACRSVPSDAPSPSSSPPSPSSCSWTLWRSAAPRATEAFEPSSRGASCQGVRHAPRPRPPVLPSFSWQVRPTSATRSSPGCGRSC